MRPGNYTITETQPTGWADGKESLGTSGGGIGSDLFSNINLPANFDGTNYNFRRDSPRTDRRQGLGRWHSGYNNGVQDPGELGISGVTIQLNGITGRARRSP